MLLADEIDADPPGTDERSGGATNSTFDPPLSYRWTIADSRSAAGGGVVTHLLRGVSTDGLPIRYDIGCPYDVTGTGSATVEFDAGGPFEPLLGVGWTGEQNGLTGICRGNAADPTPTSQAPRWAARRTERRRARRSRPHRSWLCVVAGTEVEALTSSALCHGLPRQRQVRVGPAGASGG